MKKLFAMAMASVLALSLAACSGSNTNSGNNSSDNNAGGAKKKISLTIGSAHSARALDYMESLDDFFKPEISKRVSEQTGYEIEWTDAYGTVMSSSETIDGCKDGLVDISAVFVAASAGQIPLSNYCYILPFSCADTEMCLDVTRQLYEDYASDLVEPFETNYNQKLISLLIQPSYEVFSAEPINTVADLSGKKLGGSGRNLLWLEGTGAIAVQANMTEAYTSMQTNLMQGTIQCPYWGLKANFQDVTKYMTNIGLGCNAGVLLTFNLDTWNGLPEEVQTIISEVATELEVVQAKHAKETTESAMADAEAAGLTITTMTDEAKSEWLNTLPNLPDTATELGSKGVEILEHYVELLEKAGYTQPRQWEFNY